MTKTKFSDIVEIDTLELPKIPADRSDEKLWQWTKFLAGKNREAFMELAQTSPMMNKAVGVLMELNTSQRRRMIAESRQKARWDEQARMEGAYTSGVEKGVLLGKEEGLMLGKEEGAKQREFEIARNALRDGLSADAIQRITGLSIEEIEGL